ncbi:MAG TPA: purine-nucleoside phosphorylase [Thermoanaerobaculia bacterium]|nr:purine-nucleoside phosphorylase [Thermoanaerobaculia bacterium]
MLDRIDRAAAFIRSKSPVRPAAGIILGSGLGRFADSVDDSVVIPYGEIPGAPVSGVAGHSGRLVLGRVAGVPVAVMQGRVHYYEGFEIDDVVFLPRVLGRLGIGTAIVTNAAGGINAKFRAGDLMLISDHLNFFGVSPLRGKNLDQLGPRFPDMTEIYPAALREIARAVAREQKLELREGVYLGLPGPAYETPAEIRAFRTLGADATGMSTVPEAIVFSHMQIPVLGISCITNMAAGVLPQKLTHAEVLETTARVEGTFVDLMRGVVERVGDGK